MGNLPMLVVGQKLRILKIFKIILIFRRNCQISAWPLQPEVALQPQRELRVGGVVQYRVMEGSAGKGRRRAG